MANSNTPRVIAEAILEKVGGKNNIASVAYCMTRLRVVLKDGSLADKEGLKKVEGVMGLVEQGGQLQIVLGPGRVTKVANEVGEITGLKVGEVDEATVRKEEIKAKNNTPFKNLLKKISSIFIPLIPAFIGCGLVTGILNIIIKFDAGFAASPTGKILVIIGNSIFWGLNLFVGVNAAKEFGGSPMLGGAMAAILTHPNLATVTIGGKALVPGRGGVIAVLIVVAFSSWLERKVRKIVPEILDLFVTPLIVVLVAGFVALLALQPLGGVISDSIGTAVKAAISGGGAFTGFILGGTFLPLVMTGLHQGLTPIHADLIKTTGQTLLLPILAMAGAGQVGAAIAVLVKTKNQRLKKTIWSALPVGILGVGEPLIYGVTLPLGKPFLGACIGGAFGGAVMAALAVGAKSMGLSGIPLALLVTKPLGYLIGVVVAYAAGFIASYALGFEDPQE
ncbi:putative PTS system sucrose-specific EIIBC component [Clostridiales bacterium oral taxon 876 str. F0540]|nr:putative PTS system sucrose-specific EIIBC component [Clostridiales bacterium oral taxon 876 str. F0540]